MAFRHLKANNEGVSSLNQLRPPLERLLRENEAADDHGGREEGGGGGGGLGSGSDKNRTKLSFKSLQKNLFWQHKRKRRPFHSDAQ